MARPSKLTKEIIELIAGSVLYGCSYQDSCEAVGIDYTTFRKWMQKGENSRSGDYFELFDKVTKANAQCAVNFTRVIQTAAAKGDAKYALEWLKRRRRAEWGDNVDFTSGNEKITAIRIIWDDDGSDSTPTETT